MSWEVIGVLAFVAVLLVYVGRYLPKAIKDLKKELGEREPMIASVSGWGPTYPPSRRRILVDLP